MEENLTANDKILNPGPSPKERGERAERTKSDPGYLTGDSRVAKELVQLSKNNRKEATEAESLLWKFLRNKNLGEKFRRQHPVGCYIPDFVCLGKRVIIEVDGGYHDTHEQTEFDDNRTFELEQKYLFKVIRFTNQEVFKDIETVLTRIKLVLSERK